MKTTPKLKRLFYVSAIVLFISLVAGWPFTAGRTVNASSKDTLYSPCLGMMQVGVPHHGIIEPGNTLLGIYKKEGIYYVNYFGHYLPVFSVSGLCTPDTPFRYAFTVSGESGNVLATFYLRDVTDESNYESKWESMMDKNGLAPRNKQ